MTARGLGDRYQGSKWIRREKRLALYLRDGLACVWCGVSIEDGAMLTLDHITPYIEGGDGLNGAINLVTACRRCNSSRGERDITEFAEAVAEYLDHGIEASAILGHVEATRQRPIDVAAAKALIAQRGSWAEALRQ